MCSGTHPFSDWAGPADQPEPALQAAGRRTCSGWPGGCRSSACTSTSASARPRRRWPSPTPSRATSRTSSRCRHRAPTGRAATPAWHRVAARCSRACQRPGCRQPIENWADFEQFMETLVSSAAITDGARGLVGHPPPSGLRHGRAADVRRHPDDVGDLRRRRAGPEPGRPDSTTSIDRGYTLPGSRELDRPRRTSGGPARHGLDTGSDHRRAGQPRAGADVDRRAARRAGPDGPQARVRRGAAAGRARSSTGPSYERQRRVGSRRDRRAAGPQAVVDLLIAELESDVVGT